MNNVSLVGRLTAEPELKHTPSDIAVTRFCIAVDRAYAKSGEERQADFINITAWRQHAEFVCKYFSKGQRIGITGSIRTGSYTDKDGNKRYTFEVMADSIEFVEPKKSNDKKTNTSDNTYSANEFSDMPSDEDLPF